MYTWHVYILIEEILKHTITNIYKAYLEVNYHTMNFRTTESENHIYIYIPLKTRFLTLLMKFRLIETLGNIPPLILKFIATSAHATNDSSSFLNINSFNLITNSSLDIFEHLPHVFDMISLAISLHGHRFFLLL